MVAESRYHRSWHYRVMAEQPELLAEFPAEMLPPATLKKLKEMPSLALGEIAGRDAIAAIIQLVEEGKVGAVLPTVAYNGAQCGELESIYHAQEILSKRLGKDRLFEPLFLGSPKFWQALTLRFVDELQERFGFFTPYVGCHLYVHAVRVPLAKKLGCRFIISGERESHDGAVKLTQTPAVLDAYRNAVAEFGLELLQPLRDVERGGAVVEILKEDWAQGKRQLRCALSGNYKDSDGCVDFGEGRRFSDEKSRHFLDAYAVPLTRRILTKLCRGEQVGYEAEAAACLAALKGAPACS